MILEIEVSEFKNKFKGIRDTVQKRGNEQLEQIIDNVKSPILKDLISKIREEDLGSATEYLKGLADKQKEKIEKAADDFLAKVQEVKTQGQTFFEKEVTQVLAKGVLERADKVRAKIDESHKKATQQIHDFKEKVEEKANSVKTRVAVKKASKKKPKKKTTKKASSKNAKKATKKKSKTKKTTKKASAKVTKKTTKKTRKK